MANVDVLILMGSSGDEPVAEKCLSFLSSMEIPFAVRVASAHRTPERVTALLKEFESASVIICFAGHAAHLAGVIASKTAKPVIGVPVPSSDLDGLDALLSTVQMPGGIPVASMGIGTAGSQNAGCFAMQILALQNPAYTEKWMKYRKDMVAKVESSSLAVEKKWAK